MNPDLQNTAITLGGLYFGMKMVREVLEFIQRLRGKTDEKVDRLAEQSVKHGEQIYATKEDLDHSGEDRSVQINDLKSEVKDGQARLHDRLDAVNSRLEILSVQLGMCSGEIKQISLRVK